MSSFTLAPHPNACPQPRISILLFPLSQLLPKSNKPSQNGTFSACVFFKECTASHDDHTNACACEHDVDMVSELKKAGLRCAYGRNQDMVCFVTCRDQCQTKQHCTTVEMETPWKPSTLKTLLYGSDATLSMATRVACWASYGVMITYSLLAVWYCLAARTTATASFVFYDAQNDGQAS